MGRWCTNMSDLVQIRCIYHTTYYRDEKTGKCAFTVRSGEDIPFRNPYGNINCFGYIPLYNKGFPLLLEGVWKQNNKGSYYLYVTAFQDDRDDMPAMIEYLKDNAFIGIGEQLASNILNYTGCDICNFVTTHEDAEELISENVKGITKVRVHNMITKLKEMRLQHDIYQYIHTVGGDFEHTDKLFRAFQQDALTAIKKNPYIGYKADMPFELCDALAFRSNISAFFKPRLFFIIYTVLNHEQKQGHTWIGKEELLHKIYQLEKNSLYQIHIHPLFYIKTLKDMKHIVVFERGEEIGVALDTIFFSEKDVTEHIIRLENSKKKLPFSVSYIEDAEKKFQIQYGNSQKHSFSALETSGVKNITGGPGTGKTTTIKGFIYMINRMFPNEDILLLAPTGRASQRMKEATSHTAYTIHKGIEYKPFDENGFAEKNKDNPFDQKFIIVDEMSMVGVELMSMLLDAVQNGSSLFLFGDPDQLPSVEAGNVFHDLLQLPQIETYRLEDTYRQEEDSTILYNAKLLKKNTFLDENGCSAFKNAEDFQIYRFKTEQEILEKLQNVIEKEYDKKDHTYLQVLTPTHKKITGCQSINKILQKQINPTKDMGLYGDVRFRINDKVIFLVNNYELGYFNGDIGIITGISEKEFDILVNGTVISLPRNKLMDITLAYTITIHKSQGSEFPIVVILLTKSAKGMLNKNLLFTAITRASKKVVLLSEEDALEEAASNTTILDRRSNIDLFYRKKIKKLEF